MLLVADNSCREGVGFVTQLLMIGGADCSELIFSWKCVPGEHTRFQLEDALAGFLNGLDCYLTGIQRLFDSLNAAFLAFIGMRNQYQIVAGLYGHDSASFDA